MHSAIVVSDEGSLEELNQLLGDGGWWVSQMSPGSDGSWLVILTDQDPEKNSPKELSFAEEEDLEN